MRATVFAGILSALTAGPALAQVSPGAAATFPGCLSKLKTEAIKAGVSTMIVNDALDSAAVDHRLLAVSTMQPEFKTPIWDYLAFLVDAYAEDEVEGEVRTVLRLHPSIAPVKAAVFPLMKKGGLAEKASDVVELLRPHAAVSYDAAGSIGGG